MKLTALLAAPLAAVALTPTSALADAPWTAPATVAGAIGYRARLVFTTSGQALVTDAPSSRTLLAAVSDDGRTGTPHTLSLSSALLTAYGGGIAVAGTRTATTAAQARAAPVEFGTGTPSTGIATVRALPATAGQQLLALAGNGETVALVTGTAAGRHERLVWVLHGGSLRRALTIRVGSLARGATVAVGAKGDVLAVWEDNHHLQPPSRPERPLGVGAEARRRRAVLAAGRLRRQRPPRGRRMSQRVSEADGGNATIASRRNSHDPKAPRAVHPPRYRGSGQRRHTSELHLTGHRSACARRPAPSVLRRTANRSATPPEPCIRCLGTTSARASFRSEGARAPSLSQ